MLPKAVRMLRRAEFVQASRVARAVATPSFVVQSVPDSAFDLSRRIGNKTRDIVLGITASRKVGKAVARNRAKRRLRALLYQTLLNPPSSPPSRRIVLVARKGCLDADFATMRQQLEHVLRRRKAKIS